MELSEKQKKHLRGLAHALKPVSRLGNAAVSQGFLAELDRTLNHHELIKVKVTCESRDVRDAAIDAIIEKTGATLVTRIGNVAVLYRRSPDGPAIVLPSA